MDVKSHAGSSLKKVSEKATKVKEDKYKVHCIARRRTFALLVYLVDRIAYNEAKAFEKCVASLMASKHDDATARWWVLSVLG